MDVSEFANPGKQYRPSPFWSWNDRLDVAELRRQVREMKEKGFGGFFMHSRVGLKTPYLSDEWMDCVAAVVDEARKTDMEAWLYDEDKWPSGFAGGLVTSQGDQYAARFIRAEAASRAEAEEALQSGDVLAVYSLDIDGSGRLAGYRRCSAENVATCGSEAFLIVSVVLAKRSNWFNGERAPGLLERETTDLFIRTTHQAYADRFGEEFGRAIPGIFTDEPDFNIGRGRSGSGPWFSDLPDYFRGIAGYDLLECLPLLFIEGEGYRKVRYDYWRVIARRFLETYTIPIAEWCEWNGLALTGHYNAEDTLRSQTEHCGSPMLHYKYQQVPGIDHLGRNIHNPITLKQVSSVAHQFGKNRVLCEIFGVSGHSMSFEDQKWIADYHFALGITFMNQHLTLYSMTGDRKRDYPPTFSYHQPYWEDYKAINDYFARAAYVTSQGDFVADVLVLHPVTTAWSLVGLPIVKRERESASRKPSPALPVVSTAETTLAEFEQELAHLVQILLAGHRDFDFGDEGILAEDGSIVGDRLRVGRMQYKVVVVPPSLNLTSSTCQLLTEFLDAGGKVVLVGEPPVLVDGLDDGLDAILNHQNSVLVDNTYEDVIAIVDALIPRDVSISLANGAEASDLYYHHRVTPDGKHILFISNKSREEAFDVTIHFGLAGRVSEWDLATGEARDYASSSCCGRTTFSATFAQAGSRCFVVEDVESGCTDVEERGEVGCCGPGCCGDESSKAKSREGEPYDSERLESRCGDDDCCADECCTDECCEDGCSAVGAVPVEARIALAEPIRDAWRFDRKHLNSMTLDLCSYSVNGGELKGPVPVFEARSEVWRAAGISEYSGIQPWYIERLRPKLQPTEFHLVFSFNVSELPASLSLVVEKPEQLTKVSINGSPIAFSRGEWYWDLQFGKCPILGLTRIGENTVEVDGTYRLETEIEDIYLVGDFAVWRVGPKAFTIGKEVDRLYPGDWGAQGYPFYAGNMVYRNSVQLAKRSDERIFVRLRRPKGTLVKVRLNGHLAGVLMWSPWEVDITDLAVDGQNDLEIEVVSSLRNTFGPLHHSSGDALGWTGPGEFGPGRHWVDTYNFAPWGLLEAPEIVTVRR